jgi:hypothetical protein
MVYTLVGNGTQSGYLDGDAALFNYPYGIEVIDKDLLVVCDSDNHSLRLVNILGKDELRTMKSMRIPKAVENVRLVMNSSALEMLQNAAREAAKEIRPSIIEMLLGYTNNPPRQTLGEILSLVHVLIYDEKKAHDTLDDIQYILRKTNIKERMLNLRVEGVSHRNLSYVTKQISQLKKNDDCKVN